MLKNTTEFRVRYSETDQMGRVYYANFLVYFEVARTHLIRQYWKPYADLEKEGYLLPVLNASCKYHHPVGYDDLIHIETCLTMPRPTILHFDYIVKAPEYSVMVAEGSTEHCFIDTAGKPKRISQELALLIKEHPGEHNK
jgi:acyl-CoA thioester hydrolase